MERSCNTCVFADPVVSATDGEGPLLKCKRFPPVVLVQDGVLTQTMPDATSWCGEYKSNELEQIATERIGRGIFESNDFKDWLTDPTFKKSPPENFEKNEQKRLGEDLDFMSKIKPKEER